MEAIAILMGEHKKISELLSLLNTGAERIIANRPPPRGFFEIGLDLAKQYADQAHHFKEEYVLFTAVAQKHDGGLDAHVERHRNQHEQTRSLLQATSASLSAYEAGQEDGLKSVHRNITEYVRTLRSHIRSEDEIFFPLAQSSLSTSEGESLLNEFRRFQSKHPDAERNFEEGMVRMRSLLNS